MGACLAGERFQIDMPDIHVKESYVDLSNQEDICNYYEIVQDDDRREIYQEQKKDVVARHRIHHLRNLQTYEKSDQRYVSKNARSAFKSINKSSDKLKEETYIQNVETGRQHTFVENDKSEMVDRENPEVFGYIAVPYLFTNQESTSRKPNIKNTKNSHHISKKAECGGEKQNQRTRLKPQYQCSHQIPVYIKPSESPGTELCSVQKTGPGCVFSFEASKLLTPVNLSEYVYAPTPNDMFRFKDWNNTFVIARSSHNFLNFYIDTSSQHEKKVYNQTQRHESSVGYSFLEKGDGIKLEKNSIHFRGFLLYLKNERVIDLQTQNTTICNYCSRLVPLLWSSLSNVHEN